MSLNLRILQPSDRELVMDYGRRLLAKTQTDPMELEMASWTAPWRAESLDHYLKLGWCFGASSSNAESDLVGYTLAQPFLFFRGQTQSVWVEVIAGDTEEIRKALLETLYRWARDKHMQKLVLGSNSGVHPSSVPWPVQILDGEWQIPTTRSRE